MKKQVALLTVTAMMMTGFAGAAFAEADVQDQNTIVTAQAMETPAESVTVAVDDDSFTVGPWGGDSATRTWTEYMLWTRLCYRPFTGAMLDKDELELVAAKEITKVDDTTYDVEIYDSITDLQGNPITASDVVFSYDTLAKLGYVSYIGTYYDSAEVLDDYKLEIHLKSGSAGAIEEVLCDTNIASQEWYENASEDEIQSNPSTTGAYYIGDLQTGSSVQLVAKDDFWKKENVTTTELQNVKEINIRCITEASMRSIALENNEVDFAEVRANEISRFEGNSDYNVTKYKNAMSQYLIFNTSENSVCQDENVRKAIAYAFDTWNMLLGTGTDQGYLSYDVAPNLAPDYVSEWDTEDYFEMDLEKSKEYLEAAGYGPGELEVHLMVTSQAPQGPYQAMQAMLAEAGINLVIDGYDRALRQTYQVDPTMWDISEYSASVRDFTTTFWSALFNDDNYEYGTQGFTVDPTLQELLRAAIADNSEENMNAFHDYVKENCYMVGLYTEGKSIVTKSGITDICLQKLDPILNAMTFTEDYESVVK